MFKALLLVAFPVAAFAEQPSLTIYNGGFAIVRDSLSLNLHPGSNQISNTNITRHLEPDSVILRDTAGKADLTILEQNFAGDPLTQDRLLERYEGKTLTFETSDKKEVQAKIIRAPYSVHASALDLYGSDYYATQMAQAQGGAQPIIEMDGKIQFALPGKPLFPPLGVDETLKPTISWIIDSKTAGKVAAELSYVTGGMSWKADYNIVGTEKGDHVALVGWVTMDNNSGKNFDDARINLMAGDVNKVRSGLRGMGIVSGGSSASAGPMSDAGVVQKPFDEFHLYSLPRPVTLADRETKQVEFLRAESVRSKTIYVYDGVLIDENYAGWGYANIRANGDYGSRSNPKVWVMREIRNDRADGLGAPLPKGRVRFYQKDGSHLEFVGENMIGHTPEGETLRIFTGDSFDLVGERRQTQFNTDSRKSSDETFEIHLRNRKKEAVDIRVVEHLYRGQNWEITKKSDPFEKKDSNTIEFRVPVAAGEEKVLTYSVHYTW